MTSGSFESVPLYKINVFRDARQRRSITDLQSLVDSIRRVGLIHPLVIDREYNLVSGERRFEAVKALGWDRVYCQFNDSETDLDKRVVELEENIKRVDLTWQEQCNFVNEYHRIKCAQDAERGAVWTQDKTAEALGVTQPTVARYILIQDEVQRGNDYLM